MTGTRYPISGKALLKMNPYIRDKFGIVDTISEAREVKMPVSFPEPKLNLEFIEALKTLKIEHSIDGEDRLIRCHGQNIKDLISLRSGKFERIPDVVLWPASHADVAEIVKIAHHFNVVIIPFGGGTSVSGAVSCPQDESERCISVLDTSQMNRMLWLDKENLVARFEAGIVGQDLEKTLAKEGLTMGHEPDSQEFSTLGGWIATRASGMKRNVYGNIEDMVLQVKMVTCKGVLERTISAPRVSCGPDFNQIILGSEGTLGVVTEVLVKVRPIPKVKKYGSLVFPDFELGVKCLREIAKERCQPSSIRLIDNEQFQFGHALSADSGFFSGLLEKFNKFALTTIKGFECDKVAVSTLLFEGEKDEVERQEKRIYEIAKKFQGFSAGEINGMKGYV